MKLFITSGTQSFLNKMIEEYPNEELVLMQNEDQFLLIQQSEGASIFKEPRKYDVIVSQGKLPETGIAYFHHIPVTDEGRPLFEYHFKYQLGLLDKDPNLASILILRPLASDTYLIITVWEHDISYKNWQPAKAFEEVYSKTNAGKESKKMPKIFPRPSYVRRYTIINDENT